ncbi:MAG: hypothetical protein ABI462_04315 [Ignavibacteria bacterium]
MKNNQEHLETISEIKELIDRSSRFRSLGGASGISAGIVASAGAVILSLYLKTGFFQRAGGVMLPDNRLRSSDISFIVVLALVVFFVSLALVIFLTSRNAKKRNIEFWEGPARRVFINGFLFLFTGGIFCGILIYYGIYFLIVPSMLVFYGLSLINVSKFTFNEIAQLGILEITLGIIAAFVPLYPLLMWLVGFGILHMIYGILVYVKYEKPGNDG